jgi:predicted transposase/invertase (TIGR01784 family)
MVDFENIKLHRRRKAILFDEYNIEPEYEIPFHKPFIMEEDIPVLTDEQQSVEAAEIYYEIAHYISSFEPERLKKKEGIKEGKEETAKELIKRGVDIDIIEGATGLSKEELKKMASIVQ